MSDAAVHESVRAEEYDAAAHDAAIVDRTDRALVRVHGRDPLKMVQGLISNDLAGAPDGQAVYATLLTPKGRMVADLRALRRPPDVLLDVDRGALDGLLATLKKFVPPLFARFEDMTPTHALLSVCGPRAREVAVRIGGAAPAADAPEDAFVESGDLLILRSAFGYDLVAPRPALESLRAAAHEAGARTAGLATLDVLRIEAGRPAWGAELRDDVIPLEAGLRERAISERKGCYTGQEVIIRILHRGHVNRHLRGLLLGDLPVPARDTPLVRAQDGKVVGAVTSACASPRFGQTIGLGYVRREVEPPAVVRLGAADGPEVRMVALPFS